MIVNGPDTTFSVPVLFNTVSIVADTPPLTFSVPALLIVLVPELIVIGKVLVPL